MVTAGIRKSLILLKTDLEVPTKVKITEITLQYFLRSTYILRKMLIFSTPFRCQHDACIQRIMQFVTVQTY